MESNLVSDSRIAILQNVFSDSLVNILTTGDRSEVAAAISVKTPVSNKSTTLPVGLPQKGFRKMTGAIDVNPIEYASYVVEATSYFDAFEISYDDFDDQNDNQLINLHQHKFNELALRAKLFDDELLVQYIESNPTTFTGEALFADSQTWGRNATAQDNNLALSLTEANLKTAIGTIRGFKDHLGQVIGIRGQRLTLVVPSALEYTAKQLVSATIAYNGATNVLNGVCDVVVGENLGSSYWYLVAGKPFMLLDRKAPTVELVPDALKEKITVKGKLRMGVGVGAWSQIIRSTV